MRRGRDESSSSSDSDDDGDPPALPPPPPKKGPSGFQPPPPKRVTDEPPPPQSVFRPPPRNVTGTNVKSSVSSSPQDKRRVIAPVHPPAPLRLSAAAASAQASDSDESERLDDDVHPPGDSEPEAPDDDDDADAPPMPSSPPHARLTGESPGEALLHTLARDEQDLEAEWSGEDQDDYGGDEDDLPSPVVAAQARAKAKRPTLARDQDSDDEHTERVRQVTKSKGVLVAQDAAVLASNRLGIKDAEVKTSTVPATSGFKLHKRPTAVPSNAKATARPSPRLAFPPPKPAGKPAPSPLKLPAPTRRPTSSNEVSPPQSTEAPVRRDRSRLSSAAEEDDDDEGAAEPAQSVAPPAIGPPETDEDSDNDNNAPPMPPLDDDEEDEDEPSKPAPAPTRTSSSDKSRPLGPPLSFNAPPNSPSLAPPKRAGSGSEPAEIEYFPRGTIRRPSTLSAANASKPVNPRALSFIKGLLPFSKLSDEEVAILVNSVTGQSFVDASVICKPWSPHPATSTAADSFYIIRAGTVLLRQQGKTVKTLSAADWFGSLGPLTNKAKLCEAVSQGQVNLLRIDKSLHADLLAGLPSASGSTSSPSNNLSSSSSNNPLPSPKPRDKPVSAPPPPLPAPDKERDRSSLKPPPPMRATPSPGAPPPPNDYSNLPSPAPVSAAAGGGEAPQSLARQPAPVKRVSSDDMKKLFAEVGMNPKEKMFPPPLVQPEKPTKLKAMLAKAVKDSSLFAGLQEEHKERIVARMYKIELKKNTVLYEQGDVGIHFYVLEKGKLLQTVRDPVIPGAPILKEKDKKKPVEIKTGVVFGDASLLSDTPREASVTLAKDSTLWALDRFALSSLIVNVSASTIKERVSMLKAVPLLAKLTPADLNRCAEALEERDYPDNTVIVRQGAKDNSFYILVAGSVVVHKSYGKDILEINRFRTSDTFGEISTLTKLPRTATVRACGPVSVYLIPRSAFILLILGPTQDTISTTIQHYAEVDPTHPQRAPKVDPNSTGDNIPRMSMSQTGIQLADLEVLGTLGSGSFGYVQLVRHKRTNETYALKAISKMHIVKTKQQAHVLNEKAMLARVAAEPHPFIIKLCATLKDSHRVYFLMEAALGGEVYKILKEKTVLDNNTARFYAASVLLAIEHLHQRNIIYRDLKPENILLDKQGYIRLADFGFAKHIPDGVSYTLCGTPHYLSPEVISGKGHGKPADWWTLGVLIYEMLSGVTPFKATNYMDLYKKIRKADYVCPPIIEARAVQIISGLITVAPPQRLGSKGPAEIRGHPWFHHFDFDALYNRQMRPPVIPFVKADDDLKNFGGRKQGKAPVDENEEAGVFDEHF